MTICGSFAEPKVPCKFLPTPLGGDSTSSAPINSQTLTPTTFLIAVSCDKEVIIAFLELIKQDYRETSTITVLLDNATYNRAYDVVEKAQQLGITLRYLPPYSLNLTLIERLWKFFKKSH